MENKLYRPSNGSEGEWFTEKYCMQCINCNPDPEGAKQCNILCNSLCFDINEPGYPKEWTYNDKGEPICTAWKKWDWQKDGDPDDADNANAPIKVGENQLSFPFG